MNGAAKSREAQENVCVAIGLGERTLVGFLELETRSENGWQEDG